MLKILRGSSLVGVLILTTPIAIAHNVPGMIHQGIRPDPGAQAAVAVQHASLAESRGMLSQGDLFDIKSVLNTAELWEPLPHVLTICFLKSQGSAAEQIALGKRIVKVMVEQWPIGRLTQNRLTYDKASFSNPPLCRSALPAAADIKVGFVSNDPGTWSYVGMFSREKYPSMNFQGFDGPKAPTGDYFQAVVAHEMGHALGLEHEHQSPNAPKCQWDYPLIFTSDPDWKDYEDVLRNHAQLQNDMSLPKPPYQASDYDPKSIMHYQYEPGYFLDGKSDGCYIDSVNVKPSEQDLAGIAAAYPAPTVSREARMKALEVTIKSSFVHGFSQLRSLLQEKLQLFMSAAR
ncbi:MAG TPA: hypothetical protein VIW73_09050 [Candidatus Cybelea sp.]